MAAFDNEREMWALMQHIAAEIKRRRDAGIEVLDQGLPALPEELTREMSIPLAFWKGMSCAVVLFLEYVPSAAAPSIPR